MGTPKANLEWHGSTLLRRTVGILARATGGPVVVVRAAGQELPGLPPGTEVVDDPRAGKGPVQGIAAGLAALGGKADAAFVSSTDMPFLHPAFVRRVLRALGEEHADVALPVARGYPQPLAAAYRTGLAGTAERLVGEDRLRPAFLFRECVVTRLDEALLRQDAVLALLDPELDSVLNVNEPADYAAARARPAPEVTVQLAEALLENGGPAGPRTVRAATVHAAAVRAGAVDAAAVDAAAVRAAAEAEGAGLVSGRSLTAVLNRDEVTRDGTTPLVTGDSVFFLP
jgi:molybdopterin-guanine dinucleotide biosynthesis protein A